MTIRDRKLVPRTASPSARLLEMRREFQKEREEIGVIDKISIQGDTVYAIVKRGNGSIMGNEADVPEDRLTLSEILIPMDIRLGDQAIDPRKLVGRDATVKFKAGQPLVCYPHKKLSRPRLIKREHIQQARAIAGRDEADKDVKPGHLSFEFLAQLGYAAASILGTFDETYGTIATEALGGIIRYGAGKSDWDRSFTGDQGRDDYHSGNADIATGVSENKLKGKNCHGPITAFLGKK